MAIREREKREGKREKRTPRPQNFGPISSSLCELCVSVRNFLFLFIFILLTFSLYAQNPDTSRSTVVRTREGLLIRQIVYFPAMENILRYEIEIEELRQGSWVLVQEMETETNSFEVTLAAGDYRYRYTAYNRMNLLEGRSNWQNFRLNPAVTPSPESYRPFYGAYYEMRDFENSLTVYGNDFSDKTEFALVRKRKNYDWSGVSLQGHKDAIIPASVEVNENQVHLTFTQDSLKSGTYQIFARNPGGLWVCFAEVRVGFHSGHDFLFEYGYSPAFDEDGFYNSQYLRFGWFPLKTKIGNFGIGGQIFGGRKTDEDNEMFISVNVLYQYAVNERFTHNARIGVMPFGDGYWVDSVWGYDEFETLVELRPGYDIKEDYLYINLGYSLQYFFRKNFFAAAGTDFLYAPRDHGRKSKFYVTPFIGMGFQAGRWGDYAEVAEGLRRGEDYSVPVTRTPKGEHILSVGWLPMIPLYGIDLYGDRRVNDQAVIPYEEYNEQGYKYLSSFNPLGFNVRYAYIPHIFGRNKFGYDFEISYLHYENITRPEGFMPIDRLLFGVRYQRVLNDSWFFNTRVSAGIAKAYNFNEEYKKWNEWTGTYDYIGKEEELIKGGEPDFALGAGISMQYFLWRNMFAEVSTDFLFVFGNKVNIQFRPGISFGWQFRRGLETGLRLP